eukprot:scaffold206478_cov33-Tisochrysis_lutea.AAC.7
MAGRGPRPRAVSCAHTPDPSSVLAAARGRFGSVSLAKARSAGSEGVTAQEEGSRGATRAP